MAALCSHAGVPTPATQCQPPQPSAAPAFLQRKLQAPLLSLHAFRVSPSASCRLPATTVCQAARLQPFQDPVTVDENNPMPPEQKDKRFKEASVPELPSPGQWQQTLKHSFCLGGLGLHTADYAYVRVRPAHAGEGRYFVRVPEGTNSHLFKIQGPDRTLDLEEITDDPSMLEEQRPEAGVEDLRTQLFLEWMGAQDTDGYEGSFEDFIGDELRPKIEAARAQTQESEAPEEIVERSESEPYVLATLDNVVDEDPHYTTLGQGDNRVQSTEALLSALELMGVDNARIEIEGGPEVPIVDGSALGWAIEIHAATVRRATDPRDGSQGTRHRQVPVISKPLLVTGEDGAFITFTPGDRPLLTAGLDHMDAAPIIGRQFYSWAPDAGGNEHFRWQVAPARLYAESTTALQEMRRQGYIKGGTADCSIVGFGERWYDPQAIRYPDDEPCRHRLIDLTGDLSLLARNGGGGIPAGHILAYKADHTLHHKFLRELATSAEPQ